MLVDASANAPAAGDADGARRLAMRALEVRPRGVEAKLNLGNALLAVGRSDEASGVYRQAIAQASNAPDLHLNFGHALTRSEKYDEAAADLQALSRVRSMLRTKAERCFLASSDQSAKELEVDLRRIWRRWCEGRAPTSFIVEV